MIVRMEKRIEGVRQFHNPYAPNVGLVGARLKDDARRIVGDPIFVFGKGYSLSQALTGLYGEAAERDALYMRDGDGPRRRINADLEQVDSVAAREVLESGSPDDLGSTGCAAHTDFEVAARFAIHELVERFAVSLWWSGQVRPIRLDAKWSGYDGVEDHVQLLRHGARLDRRTTFFCLGCHGQVQVAMARSEAPDGAQIAIAFAAAETLAQAAQRAALELISVELETADLHAGLLCGDAVAPNSNRGLVARRQDALAQSHAHLFDASTGPVPRDCTRSRSLSELARDLAADGLSVLLADLSRDDINLPTCRAMFEDPTLQPRFPRGFELSPL